MLPASYAAADRFAILRLIGSAYLLYASDNNQNFKITQLDTDFYNVTTTVSELAGSTLEAPGIVKRNGVQVYTVICLPATDRF